MADDIKQLVAELVSLVPELAGREQELHEAVHALIALRPDAKPDAAFVAELRQRLLGQAGVPVSTKPIPSFTFAMLSPLKLTYALGGLAALAVIALVVTSTLVPLVPRLGGPSPLGGSRITRVGANAFGSLTALAGQTAVATGLGGGGQVATRSQAESAPSAPNAAPAPALDATAEADAKLIAPAEPGYGGGATMPAYTTYRYSYAGDELADLSQSVDVLRRVKGISSASGSALLGALKFGGMNLQSFGSAQLQQFMAAQDQEFGYSINVDLLEGTVNIFENWRRWPNPAASCQDEACFKQYQMDIAAVPADVDVIALANAFLAEHGISRADYGEPYVQSDWRVQYEQAQDKSQAYVPDALTVLYPLVVEGKGVYEQYGGTPMGLGVNVNIRYGRVSGVWNLMTQNYEASAYQAEADVSAIMAYLNSMSQGYPMPLMYPVPEGQPSETSQVEIELGTPTVGYMRYWQYQNNESRELLLPALVFPVQTAQTTYAYFPKVVVAPLVKEFLQLQAGDLPVRIMNSVAPPASVGGSSGSSGSAVPPPPAVDAPLPVPAEPEM